MLSCDGWHRQRGFAANAGRARLPPSRGAGRATLPPSLPALGSVVRQESELDKRCLHLVGLPRPTSHRVAHGFDAKAGSHRPKSEICIILAFSIQPLAFAAFPPLLVLLHMAHHNPGSLRSIQRLST